MYQLFITTVPARDQKASIPMKHHLVYLLAFFVTMSTASTNVLAAPGLESPTTPNQSSEKQSATSQSKNAWLGPELLYSTYKTMQPRLQNNAFGEPFSLDAHVFDELTLGDVYAEVPYKYDLLANTLTVPNQLCHAIMLHINVKGCVIEDSDQRKPLMDLYVGRKEYQHPENAFKVQYKFSVNDHRDNYTLVSMTADKGPLRTENIAIYIEFLAVDSQTSFIHFAYTANYGGLARFALNTYLATLGRNKVGFSETGVDEHGEPVYIKGIQGVVERNTMRYFFALDSYFSTYSQPEKQRFDASLNRWFDYVEKYPKQLYEVPRDEYLKAKHKERADIGELIPPSKES
ncbi:MAG: hypothetical protein PVF82_11775 [Gammaproteobacteria bacterium]|jgi:hypothetical protein